MNERFAGRFVLIRPLGEGGMGAVHLARDLATGSECAIKRLPVQPDAALAQRLRAEFETLSRIRHPAIVEVRELGFAPDGQPFLVMEYVPGLPADRALGLGDWPALMWTAARVVHGLEALHAAGIAHGDVKPLNVLVTPAADAARAAMPTDVRLVDFGLASLVGRNDPGGAGTTGFTAPEVARGAVADPLADLYAFGATLYALAVGAPPFGTGRASSILRRQSDAPPSRDGLEQAGAPDGLQRLVLRLLAPNPAERPASAREVRLELESLHPLARRPLAERLETGVFVERAREAARLAGAWNASRTQTRAVLVEGPAGIGKTSLLDRAAARAAIEGHPVLRVVRPVEREPGSAAQALLRRVGGEARTEIEANDEDGRLAEAALLLAKLATDRKPPLIVVDDAESLDERSIALLVRLQLHPRRPPCLWLWARRGEANDLLDVAADAGEMERLPLAALDRSASERLVAARLNDSPPQGLAALLHDKTQGHPGLLVETLRLAAREGALSESEGGLVADLDRLRALPLPGDFEEACLARYSRLDARGRLAVRRLAACEGRASDADFTAMGVTLPAAAANALAASALAQRGGDGVWRLTPPSLAGTLLARLAEDERREALEAALGRANLPPTERFRLLAALGRVPEAIEAAEQAFTLAPAEGLAVRAAELATGAHASEAVWWLRAAKLARAAARYEQAETRYERALAATAPAVSPPPDRDARGEAWEGVLVSLLRAGRYDELMRRAEQALGEPLDPRTRAHVAVERVAALVQTGRSAEAARLLPEAEQLAADSGDPTCMALSALSRLNNFPAASVAERRALVERFLEMSEKSGDRVLQMRARMVAAAMPAEDPVLQDGPAVIRDMIARARSEGLRYPQHEGLMWLVFDHSRTGKWTLTSGAAQEALRLAIEDGRRSDAVDALVTVAITDSLMGHGASAVRRARAALRAGAKRMRRTLPAIARVLARVARTSGRLASADRWARTATRHAQASPGVEELAWSQLELIATLAAVQRWPEATALARAALGRAPSGSTAEPLLRVWVGRGLLRAGDLAGGSEQLTEVDERLRRDPRPYAAAHAATLRAELALLRDDAAGAREAAENAVMTFEELPCPLDRAYALLELSEMALQRSVRKSVPVRDWLHQAHELFERFRDDARQVRVLRAELEACAGEGPAPSSGLSDREMVQSFAAMLRSLPDPQALAHRAMELAGRRFGAERGVLVMHDRDTDSLQTLAEYGAVDAPAREHAIGYSTRIVREVTRSGSSLIIRDARAEGSQPSASQLHLGLRSILCVPIFIDGRVGGAMYMDDSRRASLFSEADRGLLELFSRLIGLALERGRNQQQVELENAELLDENQKLSRALEERVHSDELILGSHPNVQKMLAQIHRAARTPRMSVLITGETGTGKELVAWRIHALSKRAKGPFRALNCGAVPEHLMASRLFGHVRGAFTDAFRDEPGLFERASGGTLFLDEIGEMPLEQQVLLLRVLQNREVTRLGSDRTISVDARVIAATNRDPEQLVKEGRFRQDLYFRINVIHIDVPPLRERKSDIPLLARHFAEAAAKSMDRETPRLSKELMTALMKSDWPGNVRELEHYIQRLIAMTPGDVLRPDPLPRDLARLAEAPLPTATGNLVEATEELEVRLIRQALHEAEGNQSLAARLLGIPGTNLRYRLRKYARHFTVEKPRTR